MSRLHSHHGVGSSRTSCSMWRTLLKRRKGQKKGVVGVCLWVVAVVGVLGVGCEEHYCVLGTASHRRRDGKYGGSIGFFKIFCISFLTSQNLTSPIVENQCLSWEEETHKVLTQQDGYETQRRLPFPMAGGCVADNKKGIVSDVMRPSRSFVAFVDHPHTVSYCAPIRKKNGTFIIHPIFGPHSPSRNVQTGPPCTKEVNFAFP